MFYEESKIVKLLKCQNCNKRYDEYDEPRLLPCGKTLCFNCIQNVIESKDLKCNLCLEERHCVPLKGFPINEIVASLILEQPNEVYRSKESEMLKTNLNKLEQLVNEISFDIDNSSDRIQSHCIELRRQVQLAAENKIQQINEINDLFLKQIDAYEKDCLQQLTLKSNEMKVQNLNEIKSFLSDKRSYLSRYQICEEEVLHSNENANEYKSDLEIEKMNVKAFTFNNKLLEFEMNKTKLEDVNLGHLTFTTLTPTTTNLGVKPKNGNNTKFISGSYDETIKLWDFHSNKCVSTITGHHYAVCCLLQISNERIISGSNDRSIKIWDLQSGNCIATLRGHHGYVTCLKTLQSNEYLISGSSDKTIKFWDINSGQCVNTIQAHNDSVVCLELLLADEQLLISGSYGEIKIWNLRTSQLVNSLQTPNWVRCIISYLNDRIISGGGDNTIKIWLISNDRLISGSSDSNIKIWDIQSGECLKTLKGHSGPIWSIQLMSNNDRVISCSNDKTIKLWDLSAGQCIATFPGHTKDVTCIQLIDKV